LITPEHYEAEIDRLNQEICRLSANVKNPALGELLNELRPFANSQAAHYGVPVWLCGSVLHCLYPRDIDVRVVLPDAEYEARFGSWGWERVRKFHWPEPEKQWAMTMGKTNRIAARLYGLNLDFQVIPYSVHQKSASKPHIQIDEIWR